MKSVSIVWRDEETVTARVVKGSKEPVVLLAHGAGTNQDHQSMVWLRDGLAGHGFSVVTFNYPYTEAGRSSPNSGSVLEACHRAVLRWVEGNVGDRVALAGRSMGGRIGSHLAAQGEPCAAVVLYAYPLHPIGKPDRLRIEHLAAIVAPMLFVWGPRDAFAKPELLDRYVRPLPGATVLEIEDGDHSFRVRKKVTGLTHEQVYRTVVDGSAHWLEEVTQ